MKELQQRSSCLSSFAQGYSPLAFSRKRFKVILGPDTFSVFSTQFGIFLLLFSGQLFNFMVYYFNMKKEKIIYIAGFLDADGCFTFSYPNNFRITITNTNKKIIEWFQFNFGGRINKQHLPENPNWSRAWKWAMCNRKELRPFLKLVIPYLQIKKNQAEIILKYLEKYPTRQRKRKERIPDKVIQDFLTAKERLRKLKTDKHYQR